MFFTVWAWHTCGRSLPLGMQKCLLQDLVTGEFYIVVSEVLFTPLRGRILPLRILEDYHGRRLGAGYYIMISETYLFSNIFVRLTAARRKGGPNWDRVLTAHRMKELFSFSSGATELFKKFS